MKNRITLTILALLIVSSCITAQGVNCDSLNLTAIVNTQSITCDNPMGTISGSGSGGNIATYHWSGPNGYMSNQATNSVTVKGNYTLVVTDQNGCTATTTAALADLCSNDDIADFFPPECPDPGIATPSDECWNVCISKCLGRPFIGNTWDWTPGPNPPGFCSNIQNDQWLSFMATKEFVSIHAQASNCQFGDGIQIAVYDACYGQVIYCNPGGQGQAFQSIDFTIGPLVLGRAYFIEIDGYSQDYCDFILESEDLNDFFCPMCPPGVDCTPNDTVPTPSVPNTPTVNICPYGSVNLGLAFAANTLVSGFYWTGPPGTLINGVPVPVTTYNPEGKNVNVTFGNTPGSICVRALTYFLPPSSPLCIDFTFDTLQTILPAVQVCPEDLPYILPWGAEVNTSGDYVGILSNAFGCDSIVRQMVKVQPYNVKNIQAVICAGESYEICGTAYTSTGLFSATCNSYMGCDSTTNLNLTVLNPIAQILADTAVGCGQTSLLLDSSPSTGQKTWTNLTTGMYAGSGGQIVVTEPGLFLLTNTMISQGISCTATDTFLVRTIGHLTPAAQADQYVINACNTLEVSLSADTDLSAPTINWSGPDSFSSGDLTILVTVPGDYTLTVTDPETGCSATASTTVFPPQVITLSGQVSIGCLDTVFEANSNVTDPIYTWSNSGAPYMVTVTDPETGCSLTVAATTVSIADVPELSVSQVPPVCNDTVLVLEANSATPGIVIIWSDLFGFTDTASSIQVTSSGIYTAHGIAPNGCEVYASLQSQPIPSAVILTATADTITCTSPTAQLTATANIFGLSYHWTSPNGFSSTSPNPVVDSAGIYTVTALSKEGCSDTAIVEVIYDCTSGTNSAITAGDIKLYPIPTDGVLYIDFPVTWQQHPLSLELYTLQGQIVYNNYKKRADTQAELDLSGLPAGMYLLRIKGEMQSWQSPVVLVRR